MRLILRSREDGERSAEFRAAASNIARNAGLELRDFERALDLCHMPPHDYFRHERNVAMILEETEAPIRARLVEMNVQPAIDEALRPDLAAWLETIRRSA